MSQPPQPFPYSQTILLDCNRKQSVEFSASNLANTNQAIFTNQISSGLTLDIGDQVSIQSAHISQRGAGGDIIEFGGKTLGTKNISYTEQNDTYYIGTDPYDIGTSGNEYIQRSPEGFAYETSNNITELIKMKDNEASIVISYYKKTNGENYYGLPRNFGSASALRNVKAYGGGGAGGAGASFTTAKQYFEVYDGYPIGANTFVQQASHVLADDWYVYSGKDYDGNDCKFRKIRNDNSKFTLFKQDRIVWNSVFINNASVNEYLTASYCNPTTDDYFKCDPAARNYIKVKKKVNLSVPVGYNSPNSVASDLTNQLTKSEDPFIIKSNVSGINSNSVFINSTLNRAFPCANYWNLDPVYNEWFFNSNVSDATPVGGAVGPPPVAGVASALNVNRATQYLNSYAYVGFKRPEYVEAGRTAFPVNGVRFLNYVDVANASTAEIITDLEYTEENLIKLKNFFDAQRLYPELMKSAILGGAGFQTNYSSTINPNSASLSASFADEARFIHLDLKKVSAPYDPVGDDMYNVSYATNNINTPPLSNASDMSSVPLFIAFNNNSSHLTSNDTLGNNYGNLAYGFAKRDQSVLAGTDLIAFLTEPIGGIPNSYFSEGGGAIHSFTKIGYDYHFNAYGNSAIIPSSGFAPIQYFGQQAFSVANTCRNVYIGADDPAFKYNDVDGRFEFENLHTSEKVGNFYNAGDPTPSAAIFAPPPASQGGESCYKIDKQLHYTSFSPYMLPYSEINIKHNASTGDQKTFVKVNINLEQDRIYDAHGGISLEDMGFDEKNWVLGFWGLLGFQYGQFNASGKNIQNYQVLYHNDSSNIKPMTTNADVSSIDALSYFSNAYGTNLFSNMLNSQIDFHNTARDFRSYSTATPDYIVSPTSVILSNSTRIIAKELPRKILRGYFLINSDILDQANFYQNANPLQTMAMVGKYNGANDFIQYDGGGAVFTVTRKKTITSIKTEILDPEGGLAQVGDNSGIVYRVDKQINTDLKFAENLFASMNQK